MGFGVLTFVVPFGLGTAAASLLGFGIATSILIGSLWASHTLVTYPSIRRHGIATDPAVATAVGATVITDTLALLVLAVVAGSVEAGGLGWRVAGTMIPGLGVLGLLVFWLLPRLTKWFFRGLGQERTLRFLFVFAAFLAGSFAAESVGVEGIVGAFLTGLALNRSVPNGGVLMQRVEFLGSTLLIPVFLVSVGMLIDVRVVLDLETLGLAAAFSAVALGSKWLAALALGRTLGYDRPRIGVVFSLTGAQAAATLAGTIVAFNLGMFGEQVVNAVLIVVLVTVVVTSLSASHFAPRVTQTSRPSVKLGTSVVVPIANPDAAPNLVRLASLIAWADGGVVVPLHVVTSPDQDRLEAGRRLLSAIEDEARRSGAEVDGMVRVGTSVASAVVHIAAESHCSLVLVGWKADSSARDRVLGTILDDLIEHAQAPVAAAALTDGEYDRVVLDLGDLHPRTPDAAVAIGLVAALAKRLGPPVVKATDFDDLPHVWQPIQGPLEEVIRPGDLLVAAGSLRGSSIRHFIADHPEVGVVVVSSAASPGGSDVQELFRLS